MKFMLTAFIAASILLSNSPCHAQEQTDNKSLRTIVSDETTIVPTEYGKIQGYRDGDIYTFKGIQYAKAKRFMPPQNPDKTNGVTMCRLYGPKAPQSENLKWENRTSDYDFAFQFNLEPMDEESCLVLNIWTKGINDNKNRPVFVWIHGGAFSSGSGIDLPCYEGYSLAEKGDIVVVTLNHRLNILGYLDLRGLGGAYSESVNLGQQDIVKALEWIHKNIRGFGGDPGNVTIGGQSGGGGKVSNLLAMPSAHGLFHKAIVQSGSNMPYSDGETSKRFGLQFAKCLGISTENAAQLNKFTYEELVKAQQEAAKQMNNVAFGGILPTVDGKYIAEEPIAPRTGKDIPMLIGSNLYEFGYNAGKHGITLAEATKELREKMGQEKADKFITAYQQSHPGMEPRDLLSVDTFFRFGTVAQIKAKSKQGGGNVYSFLFTWKPRHSDVGASHGMELPFMFNNIDLQREMTGGTAAAHRLAELISSAWISFIKTGDPNVKGLPEWKPYSSSNKGTMVFDNECYWNADHDQILLEFLQSNQRH